jgi:nitrate reductase gamma subunit
VTARDSDRWVTPRVVVAGIAAVTLLLLAALAAVLWLTEKGLDPDPMLRLVAQIAGGASGVFSLLLQLAQRRTVAKTERNTGVLANAVYDVADAMPRPVARHSYPETAEAPAYGAAPARGSE